MKPIEVSQPVKAPVETTWAVLTDLTNRSQWMSGIDAIELLEGESFGVGTRWRETRTMFGKEATEEMTVTAVDAGRRYDVEAASHGSAYHSVITVEPGEGGTGSRVEMRFDASAQTFLAKLISATVGRLFTGATRKALTQDLADVAAEAESRSA